jgi:hypothetical protein
MPILLYALPPCQFLLLFPLSHFLSDFEESEMKLQQEERASPRKPKVFIPMIHFIFYFTGGVEEKQFRGLSYSSFPLSII